jgi:hypothetical protein
MTTPHEPRPQYPNPPRLPGRQVSEEELRVAQSDSGFAAAAEQISRAKTANPLDTPQQIAEALTATLREYGATTKGLKTGVDPETYVALDVDGLDRRPLRITIGYRD